MAFVNNLKRQSNMNIIKINPLSIIPAQWNTRSAIDEASIRSLAESIKADGIIQTPNCIKDADGDIVCFDGNRRVAAACLLGLPEIEVNLCDITEDEAKVKTVTANLQREDDDPLLAASVIASIGGDPEVIASKLGKTTAWVRRRAKLNALDDSIKAFVGKVTLESLERISDLDADKQKKLAKKIDSRVKYSNGNQVTWRDIQWDAKNLTADLDDAIFDTADCVGCVERTGAAWFADGEEGLGWCLNCKCFDGKCKAHKDALLADAIPADAEREKVEYRWSLPDEVREEDRQKRDKKHSCAYYWFDGGELKVVWGRPRKVINAEAEAAKAEREAEREAERADLEREGKVEDAVNSYVRGEQFKIEAERRIGNVISGSSDWRDLLTKLFNDWCEYSLDGDDIRTILSLFNPAATVINSSVKNESEQITDDDLEWFAERGEDCND